MFVKIRAYVSGRFAGKLMNLMKQACVSLTHGDSGNNEVDKQIQIA